MINEGKIKKIMIIKRTIHKGKIDKKLKWLHGRRLMKWKMVVVEGLERMKKPPCRAGAVVVG